MEGPDHAGPGLGGVSVGAGAVGEEGLAAAVAALAGDILTLRQRTLELGDAFSLFLQRHPELRRNPPLSGGGDAHPGACTEDCIAAVGDVLKDVVSALNQGAVLRHGAVWALHQMPALLLDADGAALVEELMSAASEHNSALAHDPDTLRPGQTQQQRDDELAAIKKKQSDGGHNRKLELQPVPFLVRESPASCGGLNGSGKWVLSRSGSGPKVSIAGYPSRKSLVVMLPVVYSFRGEAAVRAYEKNKNVDVEELLGMWLAQGAKALSQAELPPEGLADGQAAADYKESKGVERSQWPPKVLAVFEKQMAC